MIRSEYSNGTGCSRNASAMLNIAVFAPIPRPSATTQTIVAIRCLINIRSPNRTSCQIVSMNCLPGSGSDTSFLCFFHDASIEQMDGALREIRVALVVRDHAHRSPVAVQIAQQFHHRFTVFRVEVSGRLVGHQNQWITHQSASHGDTLLLTAGELRRIVPQSVRHTDTFQRVLYLLLPLRRARAAIRQQQRVAVARALVGDPLILMADEPTGNLDSKNGEAVMELLRDLHRNGATVCMVTHDQRYANFAERTIHLFDGRIVEETQEAHVVA